MLTIMATPTDDEDDELEDSAESQSPTTLAAQVVRHFLEATPTLTVLICLLWFKEQNRCLNLRCA